MYLIILYPFTYSVGIKYHKYSFSCEGLCTLAFRQNASSSLCLSMVRKHKLWVHPHKSFEKVVRPIKWPVKLLNIINIDANIDYSLKKL